MKPKWIRPADAIKALSLAMQADPEYAWSWQCNLAMMAQDAGAERIAANERAAQFLSSLFNVNVRPLLVERVK